MRRESDSKYPTAALARFSLTLNRASLLNNHLALNNMCALMQCIGFVDWLIVL